MVTAKGYMYVGMSRAWMRFQNTLEEATGWVCVDSTVRPSCLFSRFTSSLLDCCLAPLYPFSLCFPFSFLPCVDKKGTCWSTGTWESQ